jgi:hypothetical protein
MLLLLFFLLLLLLLLLFVYITYVVCFNVAAINVALGPVVTDVSATVASC